MQKNSENGQILLIVVLTMILALTVGLSIASRTVTELKLARQSEESQRALQAAEAGIEQVAKSPTLTSSGTFTNNAKFTTTVTTDSDTQVLLNNGQEVDQATGSDVWLSEHTTYANPMGNGSPVTVTIYWGTKDQSTCSVSGGPAVIPALEILLLEGSIDVPTFKKYVYEPSLCSRIPGATKIATSSTATNVNGVDFYYSISLPSITNGRIMKIVPIYASGKIGIKSSGPAFPAQGSIIESTGTSGDTVRKVIYYQSFPQLPEVFQYSILSQ